MKGRIISITVALVLLAALIYVSGPEKIAATLLRINAEIAVFGVTIWFAGVLLRTERWRYLLRKAGISVPFRTAAKVYVASMFLSNVTPGKSGDPIRCVLLKKTCGDRVSSSLSSIIVERALDIGSMVIIGVAGMMFITSAATSSIIYWFAAAIAVYVVAFVSAIFVLSSQSRALRAARFAGRMASKLPKIRNYAGRAEGFATNLQSFLPIYGKKSTISVGVLYSLVIWILEGLILYVAFLSLGFDVPAVAAVTALSATTLIAVLTFLPGGLGSGELMSVAFFTSITTLTMADITAAAIVARLLSYWIYVALGAGLLATMKYKYGV